MMLGAGSHLVLAVLHLGTSTATAVLLGAMSAWCLHCAVHLWKFGTPRTWSLAAAGGFGMIALHAGLMALPRPTESRGHHHAAGPSQPAIDLDGLMSVSMAVGIVAEIVVIGGAATTLIRRRAFA
ncbi:hypothetical protein [Antrihabitans sp. YC2-6]|uniref:hypothetical protein n=1 Tax=Antrihabitans sp. YC2-6 TaxID=2799498 RepID=UPI0018F6A3AB|nr:hypothetical protein [Antrihabitans sp. YC2-6]MBJ8346657.1 hypothetical protein [Antrihabitans sp. YC2-6]